MSKRNKGFTYLKALENGWFQSYKCPIKIHLLENYLLKTCDRDKLTKAISYSLTWTGPNRHNREWDIFHNAYRGDTTNLAVYSLKEEVNSIDDLIVIDYSILMREGKELDEFKANNSSFIEELLGKLKRIWNRKEM
ncbi:hypothetical protein H6G33_10415 [Calothrix sp. FACHB-1219]|uniref:hypothetical protein n=1 Tax=unclassified Calothrix TaxID=2619626 RepID=UPI001683302E|nr:MULTISPECIES: hypothetical protein [unclassified Calothrix]MBD2201760.1 hypothetical protein [Calothrix sp. FACHB-168]MBD2217446.1 hypothetical protein [Calothrix sp. FACHB-1219]